MNIPDSDHLFTQLAEWFPLMPRPRPACLALPLRVNEVGQLAHAAAHGPPEHRLVSAAEALNKAALILSDCGLADRAHQLCWRQFELFHAHRPLAPKTAKLALQPLVNIARLHIRDGQGTRAYQLLAHAHQALRSKTATTIDGRDIDLNELIDDQPASRRELVRFLWTVLLADGTRALTRAGRWDEALEHLERHKGIGERMLDGRQVAIIARVVNGDHEHALDLLDRSSTPELWEQAVASYLTTLCLTLAGHDMRESAATMVDRYLGLIQQPTPPVFRCRLGLRILDLTDKAHREPIVTELIRQTIASEDANAAQDLFVHPTCTQGISGTGWRALNRLISNAGLQHCENIQLDSLADIKEAVTVSESSLTRELAQEPQSASASGTVVFG